MAIDRDPQERIPTNEELRQRAANLDNRLEADLELAEGPASGSRIALFAVAIIAILGVVFYGLNNSAMAPDGSTTASQTAPVTTGSNPTPATPAQKDAQKNNMAPNTAPGQTTGSAKPSAPMGAPQSAPANPAPANSGAAPAAR